MFVSVYNTNIEKIGFAIIYAMDVVAYFKHQNKRNEGILAIRNTDGYTISEMATFTVI